MALDKNLFGQKAINQMAKQGKGGMGSPTNAGLKNFIDKAAKPGKKKAISATRIPPQLGKL